MPSSRLCPGLQALHHHAEDLGKSMAAPVWAYGFHRAVGVGCGHIRRLSAGMDRQKKSVHDGDGQSVAAVRRKRTAGADTEDLGGGQLYRRPQEETECRGAKAELDLEKQHLDMEEVCLAEATVAGRRR